MIKLPEGTDPKEVLRLRKLELEIALYEHEIKLCDKMLKNLWNKKGPAWNEEEKCIMLDKLLED
jgi:hypothetical protein